MNTYKCLRALVIFLIIAGWIFSGWPRIWENPPIPPEIQEAQAAEATLYTGTGANYNDSGNVAWTNPTNIQGDTTATAATCNPGLSGSTSQRLRASNFGFAIPDGSTIDGIFVEVEQQAANTGRSAWNSVKLLVEGVESGDEKSDGAAIPNTKGFKTFGGSDQQWGISPTPAKINHLGFGVSFKIAGTHATQTTTVSLFRARITVYYTPPGPTLYIIDWPATANFLDFQVGQGASSTLTNMGNIDVQGDNTAWTLTAYMESDFTCSGNTIYIANNFDMDPQSGQSAPYYRTVLQSGTDDNQVSAPTLFTFTGLGAVNQETILSCSTTNSGNGQYRITPKLILDIPITVIACSPYNATMVLTIF